MGKCWIHTRKHNGKYSAEDIFWTLMASGADTETSKKIISSESYIQKYIQMKESGTSDIEIAIELRKELVGY